MARTILDRNGNEIGLRVIFDLVAIIEEGLTEAETLTALGNDISEYQEMVRNIIARRMLEKVRTLAASNP